MTRLMVMSLCHDAPSDSPGSDVASEPGEAADIVITPSPARYRQLIEDLDKLREAGVESNTEAILDAVHEMAKVAARVRRTSTKVTEP